MITKKLLKMYADKLMFDMNDNEYETLLKEFDTILKQMDLIGKIDGIDKIQPMHFPYDLEEILLRGDNKVQNIPLDDVLKNTTDKLYEQVKVPKVVE